MKLDGNDMVNIAVGMAIIVILLFGLIGWLLR